jgi:hypothetical protein
VTESPGLQVRLARFSAKTTSEDWFTPDPTAKSSRPLRASHLRNPPPGPYQADHDYYFEKCRRIAVSLVHAGLLNMCSCDWTQRPHTWNPEIMWVYESSSPRCPNVVAHIERTMPLNEIARETVVTATLGGGGGDAEGRRSRGDHDCVQLRASFFSSMAQS